MCKFLKQIQDQSNQRGTSTLESSLVFVIDGRCLFVKGMVFWSMVSVSFLVLTWHVKLPFVSGNLDVTFMPACCLGLGLGH